jgi:hypothetical protein
MTETHSHTPSLVKSHSESSLEFLFSFKNQLAGDKRPRHNSPFDSLSSFRLEEQDDDQSSVTSGQDELIIPLNQQNIYIEVCALLQIVKTMLSIVVMLLLVIAALHYLEPVKIQSYLNLSLICVLMESAITMVIRALNRFFAEI